MRYEVSTLVRDAPERVWAWWTDYGDVGHEETVDHGIGKTRRAVVSREGDATVLRESLANLRVLRHRVETNGDQRTMRETSDLYDSYWVFEPAPEGTRIRREVQVNTSWGNLAPKGLLRWAAQKDLDHHAREYEKSHLR